MKPRRNGSQFFLSIISALIVGAGVAYGGIFLSQHAAGAIASVKSSSFSNIFSANFTTLFSHTLSDLFSGHFTDTLHKTFASTFSYAAEVDEEDPSEVSLLAAVSPTISATAYSVTSIDKGNTLVEHDAERLLPIASVTKIVTAAVAKKLFRDTDTITVTTRALGTEGNSGRLRLGEKYTVAEIFYPLLMVSSNDAAEALAQAYDAKHKKGDFVKEMNTWAGDIGAYRTYFRDPSGLSPENVSTAHDVTIIAKWIREHEPEIFDITLTKSKTIRTHSWVNPTHFLNMSTYDGGKNGYTTEAKLTNVSLFAIGIPKRYYSVVLLGSKQRDADTLAVLNKALK